MDPLLLAILTAVLLTTALCVPLGPGSRGRYTETDRLVERHRMREQRRG